MGLFIYLSLLFCVEVSIAESNSLQLDLENFYNSLRYYDSKLGRMTQPDALNPDPANSIAHNRYAYVFNSPFKYTDPSGHVPQDLKQGWRPTNAWVVEHPAADENEAQVNQFRIEMLRELLNLTAREGGEFTFDPNHLRGVGGSDTGQPHFLRLYMRQNESNQNSRQSKIFGIYKAAFTGTKTYLDPGPIHLTPETVLDDTPFKPSWPDPQFPYTRKIDTTKNESRHLDHGSYYVFQPNKFPSSVTEPLGRNGAEILFDSAIFWSHEITHVAADKFMLNALYAGNQVAGFPFYAASVLAVRSKPGHFYGGDHPATVQEDMKPGVDYVIHIENIIRRSLNEQIGKQVYAPREYNWVETGERMQKKSAKPEEKVKGH